MQAIGLYDSNPVIPLGEGADTDLKIREIGNVLYEPGDTGKEYKIFYTGWNAGVTTDEKIHYAFSSDGISWTKSASNPVIDGRTAEDPYVIKVGATYYLFAEDKEAAEPSTMIRRWSSSDCVTWADDGQITGINNCASPVVWKEGATWYMIYENYPAGNNEIYLATSANGLAWTAEATNPVVPIGDCGFSVTEIVPDDLVQIGSTYYLLYHGLVGADWKAGIATSTDLLTWTDQGGNPLPSDDPEHIPTAMVFYDSEYVIMYYYGADDSGICRGYPIKFSG